MDQHSRGIKKQETIRKSASLLLVIFKYYIPGLSPFRGLTVVRNIKVPGARFHPIFQSIFGTPNSPGPKSLLYKGFPGASLFLSQMVHSTNPDITGKQINGGIFQGGPYGQER